MNFEFIHHIGKKAAQYIPALRDTQPVPDNLLVKPADLWQGNAQGGRALLEGTFLYYGTTYSFPDPFKTNIWQPMGMSQKWLIFLHSFKWLNDLRAVSSNAARQGGYTLIDNWIRRNSKPPADPELFASWSPGVTGARLARWISHFDFFIADAPEETQDLFFSALERQALYLHKTASSAIGKDAFLALKGLIFCALALEGREDWLDYAVNLLEKNMVQQIHADGGHVSRNPELLLEIVMILLDIRRALDAGGYPQPEFLQPAIDQTAQALRFFRMGDKKLALFHDGQEADPALLDDVLTQASLKGRIYQSLPDSGYERLSTGRGLVLFDTSRIQPYPYDTKAHSAPLAFEFCYGKDRIFVNCGCHKLDEDWNLALRATAAHNTLGLDDCNAYELKRSGHLGRKARQISPLRNDGKGYHMAECTHDAYIPKYGFVHRRCLYLGEKGHDFRGEDMLENMNGRGSGLPFSIRFHIHPRVMVSLVQNGREALLRLPNGIGWRFRHDGPALALENSIYLGAGIEPRKTKQLVIFGQTGKGPTKIAWALQREGV